MNEKKTLLLARTTSIKKLEESGSADRISYRYQMLLAFADCVVGAQLLKMHGLAYFKIPKFSKTSKLLEAHY